MTSKRKGDVAEVVLVLLVGVGVLAALALAPGIGAALKLIDPNPRKAMFKAERSLRSLVRGGKVIKTPGGYKITKDGELELARRKFEKYQFPTKGIWDQKWRVICFDIPEKRRYLRHIVQQKLVDIGCYRLQDSVFVTPHKCGEILKLIQDAFFLKKHVRGMVVTHIDDEQVLLGRFKLSRA
jgi:CRISPR/Cas system-associated endoribonuclease Cas2